MAAQLEIFKTSLSKKPYCSDDLSRGLVIRSAEQAVQKRYIQPNQPNSKLWLLFDIDRPIGLETIRDELNLPEPTFFVQNKHNHHAHLFYGLNKAVHLNSGSSQKAIRFAGAVDVAMSQSLGADAGYVGLIAKNPLHDSWRTYNTNLAYDLEDFAEYVDVNQFSDRRRSMPEIGLGRNVALFDTLRRWSYKAIRQGWPEFKRWYEAVFTRAQGINAGFAVPLPIGEVKATAKSVAKWVHARYSKEEFSAIQAARGVKSGQARLALSQDKQVQAVSLYRGGVSKAEIARMLSVSRPTIYSWLKSVK